MLGTAMRRTQRNNDVNSAPLTPPRRNGAISHWMQQPDIARSPRRSHAPGDLRTDICIIGAGFTGLWLAYHLTELMPGTEIVILEKHRVGFGGSGRNAGWLSALAPGNRLRFAQSAGTRSSTELLQRRMIESVDEVLALIAEHGIDASARRSGNLVVARNRAAMARLEARRVADLKWGFREHEVQLLDQSEVADRIKAEGAIGGLFYPAVGRLDPAGLATGLAEIVEQRGVRIYEDTEVTQIFPQGVESDRGTVRATTVLRCTEAYTSTLGNDSRRLIPVNSSIIITDPLPEKAWDQIGWSGYELFSDASHVFSYSQRTDDGRILLGGRGNPYRYGSGTGGDGAVDQRTIASLAERLRSFFPSTNAVPIAHAWSGVIGVTRDWCASVNFDPSTSIGSSGGYAGHGVTSAYLASKSLAELVAGSDTADASLPWVGHRTRRWEPEPIRWLGVHGMYRLFAAADRWEEKRQAERTSLLAQLGSRLAGLHE